MNNLKKLTIATAVSAALGGTASVNAYVLGEPGGALLVPLAVCDSAANVNTMVGIVNAARIGVKGLAAVNDANTIVTASTFNTHDVATPHPSTWSGTVHWFFFDHRSVERADGVFKVTKDDFHGFDWCSQAFAHDGGSGGPLDGMNGYLVFADNAVQAGGGTGSSTLNLFGDACILQGNWGACAWDPVLPLADRPDDQNRVGSTLYQDGTTIWDEVVWNGGPNVNPINAGIPLGDDTPEVWTAHMDLRYFVRDLGLGADAETDLVFWFDRNYSDGTATPWPNYNNLTAVVFDEDENPGSTNINLPDELNILDATDPADIGWTNTFGSGFVVVSLPEADVCVDGTSQGCNANNNVGSSVAFSLIWFGPSPNDGVQTALAHNRGLW